MAWILRNWQATIYITVLIVLVVTIADLIRSEVKESRNGK